MVAVKSASQELHSLSSIIDKTIFQKILPSHERTCVRSATFSVLSLFPGIANNMNIKSTQTAKQNAAAAGGKIKAWNIAPSRESVARKQSKREKGRQM